MKSGLPAVVLAAALGASAALAQEPPKPVADPCPADDTASVQPAAPSPAASGGLVVFKDPVTGKIRQPDAAEIGTVLPRPTTPVTRTYPTKTGPGGAVIVVLDSSFESYLVATRKPDGKLAMDCVTGEKKAAEVVTKGAPAAAAGRPAEVLDVR